MCVKGVDKLPFMQIECLPMLKDRKQGLVLSFIFILLGGGGGGGGGGGRAVIDNHYPAINKAFKSLNNSMTYFETLKTLVT